MTNKEDLEFKKWKKNHKLDEASFLDGEEEPTQTVDETPAETPKEEKEETLDRPVEDIDISEEPDGNGDDVDNSLEIDDSEEVSTEDNKENLNDFDGEGESKEDDGVKEESETTSELKDILSTLTTAIQALTDKVDNLSKPEETSTDTIETGSTESTGEGEGETESFDDFDAGDTAEAEGSTEGGEGSSEGGEGSSEGGEGSSEGGEGSSEGGEGSSEGGESAPAEEEDDTPNDETKSEAWNKFNKKGKILSEKSDYLVGKLVNSRYDLLEEPIMTIIRAKIRQKIEAEKQAIKNEAMKK